VPRPPPVLRRKSEILPPESTSAGGSPRHITANLNTFLDQPSYSTPLYRLGQNYIPFQGLQAVLDHIPDHTESMLGRRGNPAYASGLRLSSDLRAEYELGIAQRHGYNHVSKSPLKARGNHSGPHKVFAFRKGNRIEFTIDLDWNDQRLLEELNRTYDKARSWRKWLSLKSLRSITLVLSDRDSRYPPQIGPDRISAHESKRMRRYLAQPKPFSGTKDFMHVLTEFENVGIEFLERWHGIRFAVAVIFPVLLSFVVSIVYSIITKDTSTGFTIGGYMASAIAACLVLLGVLNYISE